MIENISFRIASIIKNANEENTASIEVMKYGVSILLNGIIISALSLFFGFLFGKPTETLLTMISFVMLRMASGGYHFKTANQCIIISILLMSGLPFIPINDRIEEILLIISLIIVAVKAPSNIEMQSRIPKQYYPLLKLISALFILANFFIGSDIITKAFFIQSLLLLI
jgi:accessory gene regulator B